MGKVNQSITELVGKTPLLELNGYSKLHELNAHVIGKLEYFNPAGSVKDRVAKALATISKKDLDEMIKDDKPIEVNCDFCNTHYTFDVDELKEIRK